MRSKNKRTYAGALKGDVCKTTGMSQSASDVELLLHEYVQGKSIQELFASQENFHSFFSRQISIKRKDMEATLQGLQDKKQELKNGMELAQHTKKARDARAEKLRVDKDEVACAQERAQAEMDKVLLKKERAQVKMDEAKAEMCDADLEKQRVQAVLDKLKADKQKLDAESETFCKYLPQLQRSVEEARIRLDQVDKDIERIEKDLSILN